MERVHTLHKQMCYFCCYFFINLLFIYLTILSKLLPGRTEESVGLKAAALTVTTRCWSPKPEVVDDVIIRPAETSLTADEL